MLWTICSEGAFYKQKEIAPVSTSCIDARVNKL